jgi:hypothetical protein
MNVTDYVNGLPPRKGRREYLLREGCVDASAISRLNSIAWVSSCPGASPLPPCSRLVKSRKALNANEVGVGYFVPAKFDVVKKEATASLPYT